MAHHQESYGVHVELACEGNVLLRHIRFGAVRRYADRMDAEFVRHFQVIDGADARQQQRRDLRALEQRNHGAEIFLVAVRGKAVIDRRAAEPVAVRNLDERHARFVEAARDRAHLVEGHLVTLRVHTVTQRHVVNGDSLALEIHSSSPFSPVVVV